MFGISDYDLTETTSGLTLISKLKALDATGGGDCPEMAMTGLLKGITTDLN